MSHRLQVLIPEGLDRRVRKAAERGRVSKGEWVRRALERALASPTDRSDPVKELATLGGPTGDIDQLLAEIESGRG
ncbi:MAG: ribbon-helix-helix protein, CopG family [Deltaproteobacteria bacterium]|nr:ribbon-helix-helix protein, CopG family [Deltaproteobacteria bacterium]